MSSADVITERRSDDKKYIRRMNIQDCAAL